MLSSSYLFAFHAHRTPRNMTVALDESSNTLKTRLISELKNGRSCIHQAGRRRLVVCTAQIIVHLSFRVAFLAPLAANHMCPEDRESLFSFISLLISLSLCLSISLSLPLPSLSLSFSLFLSLSHCFYLFLNSTFSLPILCLFHQKHTSTSKLTCTQENTYI